MDEIVEKFADDTRQRQGCNRQFLHQLIALQVPNWETVFPHVTTMRDTIEFCAPGMLRNYHESPQLTLDHLRPLFPDNIAYAHPFIAQFAARVDLPKQLAAPVFFCATQYKTDKFEKMLAAALDKDVYQIDPVAKKLAKFSFDSKTVDSIAIAKLIRDLEYPDTDIDIDKQEKAQDEETPVYTASSVNKSYKADKDAKWSYETEKKWNKLPEIRQIKAARNLPTSSYCYPLVQELLAAGYRDEPEIVDAVDMLDDESVTALCVTKQLGSYFEKYFYEKNFGNISKRQFVKTFLRGRQEPLQDNVSKILLEATFKK